MMLLIKLDEDCADAGHNPVSAETRSAKTGRSMQQIARAARPRESPQPIRADAASNTGTANAHAPTTTRTQLCASLAPITAAMQKRY